MDIKTSIRRVIQKDIFESILLGSNKQIDKQKVYDIKQTIFEDNSTLDEPIFLFLKEDFKTINDIKSSLKDKISGDLIEKLKMIFYLDHDLKLPNSLGKKFFNSEKIAFFVGAGFSKLLGLYLWDDLACEAVKYLRRKGKINYQEEKKINIEFNPKQRLTVFHKLLAREDINSFYCNRFFIKEKKREESFDKNPYIKLIELEKEIGNVLKITINIDKEWEETWKLCKKRYIEEKSEEKIITPYDYIVENDNFTTETELNSKCLYKIHSSFDREDKIITTQDYINAYSDSQRLKGFLEKVFRDYTVIFLGTGIQEFEILEHCLKDKDKQHYALIGVFTGEEQLSKLKSEYFRDLNIQPIFYYRDFNDYDRQLLILDFWIKELRESRKKQYYEEIKILDEVLKGE